MKVYIARPTNIADEDFDKKFTGPVIYNRDLNIQDIELENQIVKEIQYGVDFSIQNWSSPLVRLFEPNKICSDISCLGTQNVLVFSDYSLSIFGDLVKQSGDLLELDCPDEKLFAFRLTKKIDALDDRGIIKFDNSHPNYIDKVVQYSFNPEKLTNVGIFNLTQLHSPEYWFFTDLFVNKKREANLTGLSFALIWDSEDENYWDQRYTPEIWNRIKLEHKRSLVKIDLNLMPNFTLHPHPLNNIDGKNSIYNQKKEKIMSWDEMRGILIASENIIKQINKEEKLKLTSRDSTKTLIKVIVRVVERTKNDKRIPQEKRETLAIALGSLWGELARGAYTWRWGFILEDGVEKHAVVSPDASAYVLPFDFIYEFYEDPTIENTIELLFNMLLDPIKKLPSVVPGAYIRLG